MFKELILQIVKYKYILHRKAKLIVVMINIDKVIDYRIESHIDKETVIMDFVCFVVA